MSSLAVGGLTLTLRGFVTQTGRVIGDLAAYVEELTGGWRPPDGFRVAYNGSRVHLVWGAEANQEEP